MSVVVNIGSVFWKVGKRCCNSVLFQCFTSSYKIWGRRQRKLHSEKDRLRKFVAGDTWLVSCLKNARSTVGVFLISVRANFSKQRGFRRVCFKPSIR